MSRNPLFLKILIWTSLSALIPMMFQTVQMLMSAGQLRSIDRIYPLNMLLYLCD